MRKSLLALSCLVLALLGALVVATGLGLAQTGSPVPDARPTPTPDMVVAPPEVPSPEDPDAPLLPDLVVASIEFYPATPAVGEETTVLVTIKNVGPVDVEPNNNFFTDLYVDPSVVPIQLGQNGVWDWGCQGRWMTAGGSYTLETTHVFTDVRTYSLYAQVDTDGTVAEGNENNNVLGPVAVEVLAANQVMQQTHQDFQRGMASSLDISHPQGVMRRGLWQQPNTEPEIYQPDQMVNDITGTLSGGQLLPTTVNQVKPALTGNGNGELYAAWEDGRNGGVFNRDIYFSRSVDGGDTWSADVRINDDPSGDTANQVSPALAYDPSRLRLYAVWQDWREGNFDIYFAYSDDGGNTWSANQKLNDDVGTADQLNPSVVAGASAFGGADRVYVVWQDRRNGNDDVYLVRSNDGGATWSDNYFVTDDPDTTLQNQAAPSVDVDMLGKVFVAWEDWRDANHPEIYAMWSWDEGETFGIDVPVTIPGGQSYRVEPSLAVSTTRELIEIVDPGTGMTITVPCDVAAIHVAWQEGAGDEADVYWAYATYDYCQPEVCPYPYDFCFKGTQQVNGFVIDSDYALPPDPGSPWPIEPAWQGQVSLVRAWSSDLTYCHADSNITYTKGVFLAWSDASSYDDWRYEIHTRRVASPGGAPKSFDLCEDQATGVLNDNVKIYKYRDGVDAQGWPLYETFKPAATGQFNPSIYADQPPSPTFAPRLYLAWDDDRWDQPLEPSTVRNRDIFSAKLGSTEGIYISPVFDSLSEDARWYMLSWFGATQHFGDLVLQTRFGEDGAPYPPKDGTAGNGWTAWTGNPSIEQPGCPGEGCYYDAPGRHLVDPNGETWINCGTPGDPACPGPYRYIQYKVIISGPGRLTALSRVTIHYDGGNRVYLPIVVKE